MKLSFLGATGTVTGSKFLLTSGDFKILIDCGLFQGLKNLRLRNWAKFPVSPNLVKGVVLTHAHIDHSGHIPKLMKDGFKGEIHSTAATRDLCKILLPDCGYLQEEDAKYANRKGFSKHHPALPLYSRADGESALRSFKRHNLNEDFKLGPFNIRFQRAGHILGAAWVQVIAEGKSILFSGDLGRPNDLLMKAPEPPCVSDYVVLESTYGNRLHQKQDPVQSLRGMIEEVLARNGVVLIPSFAVGRTQSMLFAVYRIFKAFPKLKVPVYVNSPMATSVTELFRDYIDQHKLDKELCNKVCNLAHFVRSTEESVNLNKKKGPMIIISASGMITGGRILHHIKQFGPEERNGIILPGYQAAGTRGASLLSGSRELKIHGEYVPVRAQIFNLDLISAHADQSELLSWLNSCPNKPKKVFVVHGEPIPADTLRHKIEEEIQIAAVVPVLGETVEL